MHAFKFDLQRFSVYGTSYNDTLRADTSNSSVLAYGGNDSVYNGYNYVTVDAGDGRDTVENSGNNVIIYAGGDNGGICSVRAESVVVARAIYRKPLQVEVKPFHKITSFHKNRENKSDSSLSDFSIYLSIFANKKNPSYLTGEKFCPRRFIF